MTEDINPSFPGPEALLSSKAENTEAKNLQRTIDTLYEQHFLALKGARMDTAKARAEKTFESFLYEESWHTMDKPSYETVSDQNAAIAQFAEDFFTAVHMLVVAQCFDVYAQRLEEPNAASQAEHTFFNSLSPPFTSWYDIESVKATAQQLYKAWWRRTDIAQIEDAAKQIIHSVDTYVLDVAWFNVMDKASPNTSTAFWHEALAQGISIQCQSAFRFFCVAHLLRQAENLVNLLDPTNMPLEVLRTWAGVSWIDEYNKSPRSNILQETGLPEGAVNALSMQFVQTVDRASRGIKNWVITPDGLLKYVDPNNRFIVSYDEKSLKADQMLGLSKRMNPRTADVWRVITAIILKAWPDDTSEPPSVWIDARELCDELGFRHHLNGGHKRGNVATVLRALRDLDRLSVTLALNAKVFPRTSRPGERKQIRLKERQIRKVLQVIDVADRMALVDGESFNVRWQLRAGEWLTEFYPRGEFAPLFKALVALPADGTTNLLAKALSMEIIWQYRSNEGQPKTQQVRTMLRQAGFLDEALKADHKRVVIDIFEEALEILKVHGVCSSWEFVGKDFDAVRFTEQGRLARNGFKSWLDAQVKIDPPVKFAEAMQRLAKSKRRRRK